MIKEAIDRYKKEIAYNDNTIVITGYKDNKLIGVDAYVYKLDNAIQYVLSGLLHEYNGIIRIDSGDMPHKVSIEDNKYTYIIQACKQYIEYYEGCYIHEGNMLIQEHEDMMDLLIPDRHC